MMASSPVCCRSFQGSEPASMWLKAFSTPRSLNLVRPFAVLEGTKQEGFLPIFFTPAVGPFMSRFFYFKSERLRIKCALWRCSPSCSFMIAWRPSKLGPLPPGAIPSSPTFQLMPSLSPLLALAPLQPRQQLEKGTDATGSVVVFAGKLSAGAAHPLLCFSPLPCRCCHTQQGREKWPGAGGSVGPLPQRA